MNCPYCDYRFKIIATNATDEIPNFTPVLCMQGCGEVSVFVFGFGLRKLIPSELEALKKSPAWETIIAPAKQIYESMKRSRNAANN